MMMISICFKFLILPSSLALFSQLEKMDKTLAVLLAAGADVIKHTQPEPLIFCAIKASSHDAFQLLRSKGADIHYKLGWKVGVLKPIVV